jgi:diketogulonate reductase-like aldo/keto reductase
LVNVCPDGWASVGHHPLRRVGQEIKFPRVRPTDPNPMTVHNVTRRHFLEVAAAGIATLSLSEMPYAMEPVMQRAIPKSGELLPMIGLGTWQAFDVSDASNMRAQQREVLQLMFEAGGSVVDASPMYGRAESVVGDLLAETKDRQRTFLASKVWTEGKDRGITQMEKSLRLMRTDVIDLMQIHNLVDWRIQLETLRLWKAAGIFRYTGITHYTNHAIDELVAVMENEDIDFVQMAYSIGERAIEDKLLPVAAERGIAIVVNRPFEGGNLFASTAGESLPDWAQEFDCTTWSQFFLKFVMSHPAVTCVIPATSKPNHMIDNLGAGRGRLPNDAMRRRMIQYWEDV